MRKAWCVQMAWKGIKFPFTLAEGGVETSQDLENIRESIWTILSTRRGERVMRPDFGSNWFDLIDSPVNRTFLARLKFETVKAIKEWEPRVKLLRVQAGMDPPGWVVLETTYRVLELDIEDTLKIVWDREAQKWRR